MKKSIALLRGINVGGKRKVLMQDLKLLFENIGYAEVSTYIQSGNVIFNATKSEPTVKVANKIEAAISKTYGFDVPVVVISAKALKNAVQENPFLTDDTVLTEQLHLTFLKETPDLELLLKMSEAVSTEDKFKVLGNVVYLYCQGKYHKSKLSNQFFESKLKISATTRNWKTSQKLAELSS
ncbi:DUF1697 domain-containing protein [Aquimarina agarivorans]|uniref:DUF1697 domain-containing protein n=1 Tax=Aquimarina agarivorans TaxID=980584 RepID=UPI000248E7F7|nr:DUF1697 domain-containing protein [Aquimarina agarivorans]